MFKSLVTGPDPRYKQNLSVNSHCAHFRELLLVEILEQPIRMLKNECSIIYAENIFIGLGPELMLLNFFGGNPEAKP